MSTIKAKIISIQETSLQYIVNFVKIVESNATSAAQTIIVDKSKITSFKQSRINNLIFDEIKYQVFLQSNIEVSTEPELFALINNTITFSDDNDSYHKLTLDFGGDVVGEYGYGEAPVVDSPINVTVNKVTQGNDVIDIAGTNSMWAEIKYGMGELSTVTFNLTGGAGTITLVEQGAGTVEVAVGDQAGTMPIEKIKLRWTVV